MKKTLVITVLVALLCTSIGLSNTRVHAIPMLGNLSCWYSDAVSIGRWGTHNFTIYRHKMNTNGYFFFLSAFQHSVSQWASALPISITAVNTPGSQTFSVYGGTVSELATLGYTSLPSGINGITYYSCSAEGGWSYGTSTMQGYKYTSATCLILDNGNTSDQYKKTTTHEMGHALGWQGHSGNAADIMYSTGSSVTNLTFRDQDHLSQVY